MKNLLSRMKVPLGAAGDYYTKLFEDLTTLFGGPPDEVELLLPREHLLEQLEAECSGISFPQIYDEKMEKQVSALEQKSAIGINLLSSLSLNCVSPESIRDLQHRTNVTTDEVYALLKLSEESPAPMAAILVAGWNRRVIQARHKLDEIMAQVKSKQLNHDKAFETYSEQLYEWDRNLMKSVESAKVHQILI
jgi:hypothetical protein